MTFMLISALMRAERSPPKPNVASSSAPKRAPLTPAPLAGTPADLRDLPVLPDGPGSDAEDYADVFAMLACYFAIIQGLIFTLLLLGLAQKALPALPISIALGVVTYVGTRYAFEPVMQQLLQKGLYF